MGDRSQVCVKNGEEKVYLYGHWIGSGIYKATAQAMKRVPGRLNDPEYLARAIFCEMLKTDSEALDGETGFGIGVGPHSDIEHPIPVVNCDTRTVEWEKAGYGSAQPTEPVAFAEFMTNALSGKYEEL